MTFRVLGSLALTVGMLGYLTGGVNLLGLPLIASTTWKLALVLAALILVYRKGDAFQAELFILAFVFLLLSDFANREYTFFLEPAYRGYFIVFGLVGLVALRSAQPSVYLGAGLLLLTQICISLLFLKYADGKMIFSDDHPSFFYRLHLLREHFPNIPFYNVDWNAGYSAREFFPSGVLNVFFLAYPLISILPSFSEIEHIHYYNYIICYLFIILLPWSTFFAGRVLGLSAAISLVAALLALGPSMKFFEFLLKYGTLGFSTSACLVPLTLVLCAKLGLERDEPPWLYVPALLVVSSLCLVWTLSFLAFVPAVLMGLPLLFTQHSRRRLLQLACFAIAFLVVNGPWIMIFIEESKVATFLVGSELPGKSKGSVTALPGLSQVFQAFEDARPALSKVNPLLYLCFLPGVFLLPRGRWLMLVSILWLMLVAIVGDLIKPQLELKRMLVPASFLMCLPTAALLCSLLHRHLSSKRLISSLLILLTCGSVMLTPLTVGASFLNRSDEKFILAPKELFTLTEAIGSLGKRTMFLGFILQELGADNYASQNGGHIAALPIFTGSELYASHYYHKYWTSVDPIPKTYRKRGEAGIEDFLDLLNIQAVVTHSRAWLKYCRVRPHYKEIFKTGRFRLWVRERENLSPFLRGAGSIERVKGGLIVTPQTEELVLRYRYLPKLKARGVELFPEFAFQEDTGRSTSRRVDFIGMKVPPELIGTEIEIRY